LSTALKTNDASFGARAARFQEGRVSFFAFFAFPAKEIVLRKEDDADVPGWIVVLSKPETMRRPDPSLALTAKTPIRRP
jgi:hypothetical protein